MITASELITRCLDMLRDPHMDWHQQARMLDYVNRSIRDIARRSQSITSWLCAPVFKDIFRYPLPDDFLHALIVGFETSSTGWYPLSPRTDKTIDTYSQSQFVRSSTFYPKHYSIAGRSVIDKYVGTVDQTLDAGLTFSVHNAPMYLFQGFVEKGDIILNMTDGSEAVIIAIDPNGFFDHQGLIGGTDNLMESDDEVRIISRYQPRQTINLAPPPPTDSTMGEEPLSLFYARDHYTVTQQHIDDNNDHLELDLEFESSLENRVCYYGSISRYDVDDRRTRMFKADAESDYKKAFPAVNKRVRDTMLLWQESVEIGVPLATVTNIPNEESPFNIEVA